MMNLNSKLVKKNKKKLVFAATLFIALVLTTGTFAYTYSGHASTDLDTR